MLSLYTSYQTSFFLTLTPNDQAQAFNVTKTIQVSI